jgi:DNA-binding YbaB/EbfC family protein
MVAVKMNGAKKLISIQIEQEVVAGGDKEMLQDLIVAAVNEAVRKVDDSLQGQMGQLAGMKLPGL